MDTSLFQSLSRCRFLDGFILKLYVSSRKQPAVEPPVVDQKYGIAIRVKQRQWLWL